jgi:hypothetical protein
MFWTEDKFAPAARGAAMSFNHLGRFKSQQFSIDVLAELVATRSLTFRYLKDVQIPNTGGGKRSV